MQALIKLCGFSGGSLAAMLMALGGMAVSPSPARAELPWWCKPVGYGALGVVGGIIVYCALDDANTPTECVNPTPCPAGQTSACANPGAACSTAGTGVRPCGCHPGTGRQGAISCECKYQI